MHTVIFEVAARHLHWLFIARFGLTETYDCCQNGRMFRSRLSRNRRYELQVSNPPSIVVASESELAMTSLIAHRSSLIKGYIRRDCEAHRLSGRTDQRRNEKDPIRRHSHLGSVYIVEINSASSKLGSDDNFDLLRLQDVQDPEDMMTLGAVETSC